MEKPSIDWTEYDSDPDEGALDIISKLTDKLLKLEDVIAEREEELKVLKAEHLSIAQGSLPESLTALGLTQLKHVSGKTLTIKEFYQVSIKDQAVAFKWLEDTGNDSIIKTDLTAKFGKGEKEKAEEAAKLLDANHILCSLKTGIHHSTLRAFVKEQVVAGTVGFPTEAFGLYIGKKVVIK